MARRITNGDLLERVGTPGPRAFLYCDTCGERNSADFGDYWNVPLDHVFKCCRRNMRLVVRTTSLLDVS